MLSNWNSRITTAEMEPVYKNRMPQDKGLLSIGAEGSSRVLNTTGLRGILGIALQKCSTLLASMFVPPEIQTNPLETNRKSLTVPDICVDISVTTPIFEAVQGKAKLTIPMNDVCDETKSTPFGCTIDPNPVGCKLNSMKSCISFDMAEPQQRQKTVSQNKSSLDMNNTSCNETQKVFIWPPDCLSNKSGTCDEHHKPKNQQNLQVNIMEDLRQIVDEQLGSEKTNNILGCPISFSPSSLQGSPLDIFSKTSSLPFCSSISKDTSNCTDPPGGLSYESDSEESFVMLFDMTTPLTKIDVCSTGSLIPSVLANHRQRCRQISECSDDSIVFRYEDDENDAVFDPDYESEEDEMDDDSCEEDSEDIASYQPDSGFEDRKVKFNLKPEVHVMRTWDFAYRQARKGEWEMAARDRDRFKKRILETDSVLSMVFDKNLRDRIYKERFSC